jgi:hypothetical protein
MQLWLYFFGWQWLELDEVDGSYSKILDVTDASGLVYVSPEFCSHGPPLLSFASYFILWLELVNSSYSI